MVETSVILPPDYKPSADEEYMNEMQVEYFRQKLLDWKKSLLAQSQDTLEELRQGGLNSRRAGPRLNGNGQGAGPADQRPCPQADQQDQRRPEAD